MQDNLKNVLRKIESNGTSPRLLDGVMEAVFIARRRQTLLRRLPFLVVGLVVSAAGAVYGAYAAVQQADASGLVAFLSAAATDTGAVLSAWQSYAFAVIDALPVPQIAAFCGALFVFFALLRSADRLITSPHSLTRA
jgi:hypothetical protein